MKNYFLIFAIAILLLSSCGYAEFDRFPGERLTEVPDKFIADFLLDESKNYSTDDEFKIEMRKQGFSLTHEGKREDYTLNDTNIVLSQYGNAYFVSIREAEPAPHFSVLFIERRNKNYLELKPVMAKNEAEMERRATEFFGQPTLAEKEGWSTKKIFTMNEDKLLAYYEKYMRKQRGFLFKRIKQKGK